MTLNHTRNVPKSSDEQPEILNLPIVMISNRKFGAIVDGTTRINRWLTDGKPGPYPAYSMRIRRTSSRDMTSILGQMLASHISMIPTAADLAVSL